MESLAMMSEGRWDSALENTLRKLVTKYLRQYLYENATFLAERLYAQSESSVNLNLLATCYLRSNAPQRAYGALTRSMDVVEAMGLDDPMLMQNRYLLAKACLMLGHTREAESALIKGTLLAQQGPQRMEDDILRGKVQIPNGAAGLYLLGLICERDNRREHAISYFALALRLDPFLWDAYEHLCKLGVDVPPESFFGRTPLQFDLSRNVLTWETNPQAVKDEEAFSDEDDLELLSGSEDEDGDNKDMDLVDEENAGGHTPTPHRRGRREPSRRQVETLNDQGFDDPAPIPVPLESSTNELLSGISYVSSLRLSSSDGSASTDDSGTNNAAGFGARTRSRSRSRTVPGVVRGIQSALVGTGFSLRRTTRFPWHPNPTLADGQELCINSSEDLNYLRFCKDGEPVEPVSGGTTNTPGPDGGAPGPDSNPASNRPVTRRSSRRTVAAGNTGAVARGRGTDVDTENQQMGYANVRSNEDAENAEKPADHGNPGDDGGGSGDPFGSGRFDGLGRGGVNVDALIGSLRVLDLFRAMGQGFRFLNQYKCDKALQAFGRLPLTQQATGWVAHQQGRACFEMADYRRAKAYFENMRAYAPDRTAGLEIYSTNLWHLKEEVELCYLAQQAVEIDKRSPEVWCVLGNCFSLQKEHDLAIKFFKRALMLDPTFTYASTLSGHEYVSNEDFEKATSCYRAAISSDARHYPAWYGLGTIYYRQEKYSVAEFHFRRAVAINPRSSVLYCYLGMVLHASDRCEEALDVLLRASRLEPGNPQARFQRALVLRTMECYEAALNELEAVRDFAPHESSVHFLMGKLCKQLDCRDEAMIHFTTALDLDPKDANLIKLAIDKLDSDDMDEVDEL